MKEICKILGTIVLILGVISSILLAWNNGVTVDYSSSFRVIEKRDFILTISWFLGGIFSTAIMTTIFYAFVEIIENQENILFFVRTTNATNEQTKIGSLINDLDSIDTGIDTWKCPQCGRVNPNYTGTCGCGQAKS